MLETMFTTNKGVCGSGCRRDKNRNRSRLIVKRHTNFYFLRAWRQSNCDFNLGI